MRHDAESGKHWNEPLRIQRRNGIHCPEGGKMRRCLYFSIALVGWFLTAVNGHGAETGEFVVTTAYGQINWTKGWVQTIGSGKPSGSQPTSALARKDAVKAAYTAARKNLLLLLESIYVQSDKTVGELLNEKSDIRKKIADLIQALRSPTPPQFRPNGSAEVRLHMPLHGPFTQLILPPDIKQIEPIRRVGPVRPPPASPAADNKDNSEPGETQGQEPPVHSGMIVDAKGLIEVKPMMVPKIVDETGKEIYGPAFVSREYAVQSGMTSYMKEISLARENIRVKPNPLILKGLRTEFPGSSSIVVSNTDASRLRHVSEHLSFLKQCHVIILLD